MLGTKGMHSVVMVSILHLKQISDTSDNGYLPVMEEGCRCARPRVLGPSKAPSELFLDLPLVREPSKLDILREADIEVQREQF